MSSKESSNVGYFCQPDRLYLQVEDNKEVYVASSLLKQHQIDGLRFLYEQFIKKSTGVIVNFPQSCGKSATVAVFLNAVSNMLKHPVLIFCKDDDEVQYWKGMLLKWSYYLKDDIAVESPNPFIIGKKVFLKKRENLYSYVRRRWGALIIKENVYCKETFKQPFEADFKICITAADVKKDMLMLTAIFSWLYPKRKININDFEVKENRPKEKFRKSVQLDLILEDVVIRRYLNIKPFQTTEKQLLESLDRNNDNQEDYEVELKECNNTKTLKINEKPAVIGNDSKVNPGVNTWDLDNNLTRKDSEFLSLSSNSKINLNTKKEKEVHNQKVNETLQKRRRIESLVFDKIEDDLKDFVKEKEESNDVSESVEHPLFPDSTLIKLEPDAGNDLKSLDLNNDDQHINEAVNETKNIELKQCENSHTIIEETPTAVGHYSKLSDNKTKDLDKYDTYLDNKVREEFSLVKNIESPNTLQQQLAHSLGHDDIKEESKVIVQEEELIDVSRNLQSVEPESGSGNVPTSETTDNASCNKRKSDVSEKGIDDKILDMEEKALKKFKGSFLDSLF